MVRQVFQEQIRELLEDLLEMGQRVANSIDLSIQALARQDDELAQQVIDFDPPPDASMNLPRDPPRKVQMRFDQPVGIKRAFTIRALQHDLSPA